MISLLELAPWPPADLASRTLVELEVAAGEYLHRFYTAAYEPMFFDRGRSGRLNAPDNTYGVLYTAKAIQGAFAETFLRNPGLTQLPADLLAKKAYVEFALMRPLRLVRMAGPGLARLGATAQVVHGGKPYEVPQAWSGALHAHPAFYDGIAYNARHDDEALCYAIFERATSAIREVARKLDLDQDWFWDAADLYGVGLPPA